MEKKIETKSYLINPSLITVKDGFNSRSDFGDITELAGQIESAGLKNPIHVSPYIDEHGVERYALVDGERRYRALMQLINDGKEVGMVPAIFTDSKTEVDLVVEQIMCNLGKNFNEFEMAVWCKKLIDLGKTRKEVSEIIKKPEGNISQYLDILDYDSKIQDLIKDGRIGGRSVWRIYNSHKGNPAAAVAELMELKRKADEMGKFEIKLSDLDCSSAYVVKKDSAAVKNGLLTLRRYVSRYTNQGKIKIKLSLKDITDALSDGKNLDEIFTQLVEDATAIKKAE